MTDFKVLILGGTADGRKLAVALYKTGVSVVYSIAGLVRTPDVKCELLVGGFTQFGGLTKYIQDNHIGAVMDVTHPYAEKMSTQAVKSAGESSIPCWRFHRLPWRQAAGDQWFESKNWNDLITSLCEKRSVFLTAGQLDQNSIDQLAKNKNQTQILRTAVEPKTTLPKSMTWIKAIGPFEEESEAELINQYQIDALVCKNSGGDSTVAKLHAARKAGIPVYMHQRPILPPVEREFTDLEKCKSFILTYKQNYELPKE